LGGEVDFVHSLDEAVSVFRWNVGGQQIRSEEGVAVVVSDEKKRLFYVFFKREWFHSYARQFPQEHGEGFGQSVSLSILKKAVSDLAMIVIVFPDGKMYARTAQEWLNYAQTHRTIRHARDGDITASVPSRFLQRFA
jgi:hypothetical protein